MRRAAFAVALAALAGCDGGEAATPPDAGAPCTRETCTTGCCDDDGRCRRDDDVAACGSDGRVCVACAAGESCRGGVCLRAFVSAAECDAASCAGCCRGRDCVTTPVDAYCGGGGAACVLCAFWERCEDGACVVDPARCGPHTCGGCCVDGYTCHDPPTDALCGSGGLVCENCPEGGYRACVDGICVR